jgi:hypothetical protein
LVFALAAISTASATVSYTTTGTFNCTNSATLSGCGTSAVNIGPGGASDLEFSFTGSNASGLVPPTGNSIGDFFFTCFIGGTGCGPLTVPTGITLTINISQTSPTSGSGNLSIDGTLVPGGSPAGGTSTGGLTLNWTPSAGTLSIGSIKYTVANFPYTLVPPSSNGGDVTLQASIVDTTAPEPTTLALMGAGLVAIGFVARRRRC